MARKLFEKGDSISLPPTSASPPSPNSMTGRPRTAIGGMAQFVVDESKVRLELESLRAEHAKFEDAKPARLLDPRKIKPSQWANRHEDSFLTEEFFSLRSEIENAGGNVQAIKVRPVTSPSSQPENGQSEKKLLKPAEQEGVEQFNPSYDYEIIFGHRRHRACLDLGIPVLAVIEEASEQDLFIDMDRENRLRADLSPWEQGMMYAKALDKGLFSSNGRLATAVGRDTGVIGKALALARLPAPIVEAFPSPLQIQYRWAKPLTDRLQADPEAMTQRARALKTSKNQLSAKEIFELLTSEAQPPTNQPVAPSQADAPEAKEDSTKRIAITQGGKTMATLSVDTKGFPMVRFKAPLGREQQQALARLIEDFLISSH